MTDRKDVLMTRITSAFAQGCGTAEVSDEAAAWFHGRYYDWIHKKKTNPEARGTSPQDVWDSHGKAFLGKFREIGQQSVTGGTVQADVLQKAALAVERASECPWCPDKT